ncbi:MAG: hypothetical protein WEA10_03420 [Actinomycetota bacterium]
MHGHGQRGEIGMGTALVAALVVGAIAAAAFVFMGRAETDAASTAIEQIPRAESVQTQLALDTAMRGAQVYFAENGSFTGYSPAVATQNDPSVRYSSGPAQVGVVSIRGVTPTTVVLVSKAESGQTLCSAATGPTIVQGTQDAQTAAECTGGL